VALVTLRDLSLDDMPLYEAIYLDPEMMREVGGPRPREGLAEKLAEDVAAHQAGEVWIHVIVPPDDPEAAAGSVPVWRQSTDAEDHDEIGWMVLPRYQGRGFARDAVRQVLDRARSTGRWNVLNAFPSVTNAPSNAICRSLGFTLLGEIEVVREHTLRCNHWRLDLRSPRA
jgi:RimJ/RimL family protein N-acetyltransferase